MTAPLLGLGLVWMEAPGGPTVTRKLRLLHVEDERNARLMIQDLLGDAVELVSVGSAEEGLEQLRAEPFDLTLLDWTLPGMDGGGFLAAVREHGLTYGRFIDGLNKAGIEVDRKVLSDMAINQPEAFAALVASAKTALEYLKDTTPNAFEGAVR